MGSKKPLHAPRIDPGPTVRDPSNRQRTHVEDLVQFHAGSPSCRPRVLEVLRAWINCLCGFSCHDLDLPCSCNSCSLSLPGLPEFGWLWIFTTATIIYWIKILWWQLAYSPIWLQQKAGSSILFTIAMSLCWDHPCEFLGTFLAQGFSLNP